MHHHYKSNNLKRKNENLFTDLRELHPAHGSMFQQDGTGYHTSTAAQNFWKPMALLSSKMSGHLLNLRDFMAASLSAKVILENAKSSININEEQNNEILHAWNELKISPGNMHPRNVIDPNRGSSGHGQTAFRKFSINVVDIVSKA